MGTLWQDLRYAARMLMRSPAFAVAAIASLAIGIGANTAVFSVANAVLLRPLAVPDAGRVVELHKRTSEGDGQSFPVSYPDYRFYRDHNEVFSGLLCWGEATLALSADGQAEQVFGMVVSGNYFDVLSLRPAAGRFFDTDEDAAPGAHPVAVLGYGFWQSRFGGDPQAIGRSVALNGRQFTVVGVAPQDFKSTVPLYAPDVWVPVSMQREVLPGGDMLGTRGAQWLQMVGRLRPGVSVEQAEAQASALALQVRAEHPEDGVGAEGEPLKATLLGVRLAPVGSFPVEVRQMITGALGLVLAVVTLVLLIACANLSSLLLARAVVRRREIAVRLALGASRARLVRQLLTESVLLCVVSGAAGVVLALWMTDLLVAFRPDARLPIDFNFSLDWRVLSLTLALSLATGVLFGLLPALQATRLDVSGALKDDHGGGGHGRPGARDWFVVGQVAMSLVLLVSAGLLVRALTRAHNVFPGERPQEVVTVTLGPHLLGYDDARTREFYRQLVERAESLPGVESAGLADGVPVAGGYAMTAFEIKGEQRMAGVNSVSPGYFDTLGIPVVRGRDFAAGDRAGAPAVAVVDEALARRFFAGEDPVGQLITFDAGPAQGRRQIEVVGVVRGGADVSLGWRPHFFVYLPAEQPLFGEGATRRMILHARARRPLHEQTLAALRRETAALDSNVPVLSASPLAEQIYAALLPQRVAAAIAGVFGLVGLALASVGIYGLVSYTVAQRTREIGVRMALGAQTRDVLALILRRGLRLSAYGIALGLAGAFAATRLLGEMLYGLSATDPLTFAGVALLLAAVALLASYVPARRAARVDPMVALRYE